MSPLVRKRCNCWGCHGRRPRLTRLALLVVALGLAASLVLTGCDSNVNGLGETDAGPAYPDGGADIQGGEAPAVEPDARPLDAGADSGRVQGHGCDAFTDSCGGGLRCDSTCDTDPPRICNPSKGVPVGGACADHDDCEAGSICPAAPSGVCRKLCGLGHECPAGQTCNLGWCPEGVGYCQ
jgi:hypothetical protein